MRTVLACILLTGGVSALGAPFQSDTFSGTSIDGVKWQLPHSSSGYGTLTQNDGLFYHNNGSGTDDDWANLYSQGVGSVTNDWSVWFDAQIPNLAQVDTAWQSVSLTLKVWNNADWADRFDIEHYLRQLPDLGKGRSVGAEITSDGFDTEDWRGVFLDLPSQTVISMGVSWEAGTETFSAWYAPSGGGTNWIRLGSWNLGSGSPTEWNLDPSQGFGLFVGGGSEDVNLQTNDNVSIHNFTVSSSLITGRIPPEITTGTHVYYYDEYYPLPNAPLGNVYSETLQATNGIAPYSWSLVALSLPPGLSLETDGTIYGTPSEIGIWNFSVRVTGDDDAYSENHYSIAVPGYTYITNGGTITITGSVGLGGAVTIPSTINGMPVTRIGSSAFYNNTNLTSVIIPDSVTNIGSSAFFYCSSLASVTIPDSVTSIGNYAFCATSLTSVSIPDSVTSIGDGAFYDCYGLAAITVDTNNPSFSSLDGVLFDKGQTMLIQCPSTKSGTYTIPDSVTSIGIGAFATCINLTSISIPDGVISIGEGAFDSCNNLISVTIPDSVTSIGDYAFYNCQRLISVSISDSVTHIGYGTFHSCYSLTSVSIPDSVTSIGDYAFYNCQYLISVSISDNVTNIGEGAFLSCYRLTGVFVSGDAPSLGDSTVFGNTQLAIIYYLPDTMGWGATYGGRPTVLWNPLIQTADGSFGVLAGEFGFNIAESESGLVVVETCTNLTDGVWVPTQTNSMSSNTVYFSDAEWTNYAGRFYRLTMP